MLSGPIADIPLVVLPALTYDADVSAYKAHSNEIILTFSKVKTLGPASTMKTVSASCVYMRINDVHDYNASIN